MNSNDVYKSCRNFNHNHDHRFENVYVHAWEADLFSVTQSLYSYEIEVKISRSDFLADFKKPKHILFRSDQLNHSNCPNVFYYAVPEGLIHETEIPTYAGLMYCLSNGRYNIIKKAPYIHKDHFNCKNMLYQKYLNMSFEIRQERWDHKIAIERLQRENDLLKWQATVL